METLAILNYLVRQYDPEHKFSFDNPLDVCTAEQWLAWQHAGLGMSSNFKLYIIHHRPRIHDSSRHLVAAIEGSNTADTAYNRTDAGTSQLLLPILPGAVCIPDAAFLRRDRTTLWCS